MEGISQARADKRNENGEEGGVEGGGERGLTSTAHRILAAPSSRDGLRRICGGSGTVVIVKGNELVILVCSRSRHTHVCTRMALLYCKRDPTEPLFARHFGASS